MLFVLRTKFTRDIKLNNKPNQTTESLNKLPKWEKMLQFFPTVWDKFIFHARLDSDKVHILQRNKLNAASLS